MKKTSASGKMGCDEQTSDTEMSHLPKNGGVSYESYGKYFRTDIEYCQPKCF